MWDELHFLVNFQDEGIQLYLKLTTDILQDFVLDLNQHCTPILQKSSQWLLMIQMQGCYIMAFVMWFCMRLETVKRPCEFT